jgi:hypothetical protein
LLALPCARPSTPPLGMVRDVREPLRITPAAHARALRLEQTVLTSATKKSRFKQRWQLAAALACCLALLWAGLAFGMRARAPAPLPEEAHRATPAAVGKPLEVLGKAGEQAVREQRPAPK